MKKIAGIKNNYISVQNESYGGSQMYFASLKGFFNKGRQKGGCGIVALNDVFSYFRSCPLFKDKSEYMKAFNKVARKIKWIPGSWGMTFIHESIGFKILAAHYHLKLKCFVGINPNATYARIRNMLNCDCPVIICIPKVISFKKNKPTLNMYDCNTFLCTAKTQGHFVVVTDIYEEKDEIWLKISSWGREYLLNYEEFIRFVKHHIASLFGHMLCIKKKL